MTIGEGERLEAARRRKFWQLIIALAVSGAVAGFVFGFALGHSDASDHPMSESVRLLIAAILLLSVAGAAYLSWRFFQTVDEVEIAHNLWGSLIGFYVYAFMFPTWWALEWLALAPEPNDWVIFAASLLTATAAYAWRKWANR
ncbi:MAG: hypothetical protein H0W39_02575 [Sphingomonas sp.]|nr:hypothetical protein [Sphingomonas sp.]